MEEDAGIPGIHQVQQRQHHQRERAENPSRQPPLGGLYSNLTLNPKPLSNHKNRAIQNLDQVAAGVFLHHDCSYQNTQVGRRDAVQKLQQRVTQGQSQVELFENLSELKGRRFLCVARQHLERAHHGMAGAQGTGEHVDALRQSCVERIDSSRALQGKDSEGQQTERHADRHVDQNHRCKEPGDRRPSEHQTLTGQDEAGDTARAVRL